jgi:hypothetical protein
VVEVREWEDEPLLCSVRQPWEQLPWYEVLDALDQRVGRVLGTVLQDNRDQFLAVCCPRGRGLALVQTPGGLVLAQLTSEREGSRLTFAPFVAREPFLKMLLLGAALLGEHGFVRFRLERQNETRSLQILGTRFLTRENEHASRGSSWD